MPTTATLKKDLVIKAGTVFTAPPLKITRDPKAFGSTIIGLSKDTYGDLTYEIGEPGSPERKQLSRWFKFEETAG